MIINKPKQDNRIVAFQELPTGTGFRWQTWYYIKIEERCYKCINSGGEVRHFNAVQLETGTTASFMNSELVEKIPMSVEVLE